MKNHKKELDQMQTQDKNLWKSIKIYCIFEIMKQNKLHFRNY